MRVLWERAGIIPVSWDGNDLSREMSTNETTTTTLGPVFSNGTNSSLSLYDKMKIFSEESDVIEILWSITVAIFVLFGMIGSFLSGKVAERLGRFVSIYYIII